MTPPQRHKHAPFGFAEWFRAGEYSRVEQALDGMVDAGAKYLRTHLSWAEYHTPLGKSWYDWLLPTLSAKLELLPCIHYTPPSISRTGTSAGPPERLRDYADFVDLMLTRYGSHFEAIELWNEPNNLLDWDWRVDPEWVLFSEMMIYAANWAGERGWKTVLGGPAPFDANWLHLIGQRGVLQYMSAVGLHGFPGTWDSEKATWRGWEVQIAEMREILAQFNPETEVWITEAGFSTWRHEEVEQARQFLSALAAPSDRLYWYGWQDIDPRISVQEGLRFDKRHYHMGITGVDGRPKLLRRLLSEGGPEQVQEVVDISAPHLAKPASAMVVVGGAGFVGSNLTDSFLADGFDVIVLDNLSRPGVEKNLLWLKERYPDQLHPVECDIRDEWCLKEVLGDAECVVHLAAQVAVTTSLHDPAEDFQVNALGTLNVLEAVRATGRRVPTLFASTNKVYGGLEDLAVRSDSGRCRPTDEVIAARGVDESRHLDFCTPYGCSKGAADQYVLDYAKSYGLPTGVLRMSCIYGPRQFGTEDQGWVAHFLIKAMRGEPITIFGDGRQVRDILHISDAVAAYRRLLPRLDRLNGRAFNLGGGPVNAVSLLQVLQEIERLVGHDVPVEFAEWRRGDQPYFVANTAALRNAIGWRPTIEWRDGLRDLHDWLRSQSAPPGTRAGSNRQTSEEEWRALV